MVQARQTHGDIPEWQARSRRRDRRGRGVVRVEPSLDRDSRLVLDDYSRTFSALRGRLVGRDGERYVAFVRGLKPSYWLIYRDIAIGYLLLVCSYGLTVGAAYWGVPRPLASIAGAVLIGYWVAYLQLFLHEAAHYNLAPTKPQSDCLCDLLVSWLIGTSVAAYRPIHFQHHRCLGTAHDTEFTYAFPLNLMFLMKAVFGIRAVEVVLSRLSATRAEDRSTDAEPNSGIPRSILPGVTVHCAIIAVSLLMGWWWAALGWVLGIGMVFPFFGALRQLLEHRDERASSKIDYRKQNHGAYTRLFRGGLFSATFGGAGFNRHLLHHWEPQVSYTNLPELEAFLERTEIRHIMEQRRMTYFEAFRRLAALY
jgi:fatty acid desaturase